MRTISDALIARQVALEEEMQDSGIARYRARLLKSRQHSAESETKPGTMLIEASIAKLAAAFKGFYEDAAVGKTGPRATAYLHLKGIEPEIAAYMTVKKCLDRVTRPCSLTDMAVTVAKSLEDELSFRAFSTQIPDLWKSVTRALVIEQVGPTEKLNRMKRLVRRYEVDFEPWDHKTRLLVGIKCLDLLIETTGMFEIRKVQLKKTTEQKIFQATPETVEWIKQANEHCEVLSPIYLPMLVPPVEWTTPFDGGYLSNSFRRLPLIKTRNKNYLNDVANYEMPMVYGRHLRQHIDPVDYNVADGVKMLQEAEEIVGHNIIKFDIPALKKIYPWFTPRGRIRDTLVLSRLLWPEIKKQDLDLNKKRPGKLPGKLIGKHSLEAWGHRLGMHKGDYSEDCKAKGIDPWAAWSIEMEDYCALDVELGTYLLSRIESKKYSPEAIELEHAVAYVLALQERAGFAFNEAKAGALYALLLSERQELEGKLKDYFGSWEVHKVEVFVPKRSNVKKGWCAGMPIWHPLIWTLPCSFWTRLNEGASRLT